LTRDQTQRTQKLTSANFAITVKQGVFKKEMEMLTQEHHERMRKLNQTIYELNEKKKSLERTIESCTLIEREAERAHRRLEGLAEERAAQARAHAEELEQLRKESFNTQMQLERTNRRALKELEAQYAARAAEEMRAESLHALKENAHLQAALGRRSREVAALVARQKGAHGALGRGRAAQDVLEAGRALEEKQAAALEQRRAQQERELADTRVYILQLHKALKSKKEAIEFSTGAHAQLEETLKNLANLKSREETAKSQCLEMVKQEIKLIHEVKLEQMKKNHSLPLLKMMGVKTDDLGIEDEESLSFTSSATTAKISYHEQLIPLRASSSSFTQGGGGAGSAVGGGHYPGEEGSAATALPKHGDGDPDMSYMWRATTDGRGGGRGGVLETF